jgi:signal transduction histidine kinase
MEKPNTGGSLPDIPRLERWVLVWGIIAYAMLVAALVFCLTDRGVRPPVKAAACGLSVVWAGWYWFFVVRGDSSRAGAAAQVVSFALSVLVASAMSFCHPAFSLLLFGYYGIALGALPPASAFPIVVLCSLCLAARFVDLRGRSLQANVLTASAFLAMALLDGLLGLFIGSIVRRSRERQRMVEDLEAARADLARAEREAGALAERQRLAGEIHDTLAQGFTGIVLHLSNALASGDRDAVASRQAVRRALEIARDSLDEARRVVWALRPEILQREPFSTALTRAVDRWSATSGVAAETAVTGTPRPLGPDVEVTLLRAAQEGLANVMKHAAAGMVSVTLSFMGDQVALDVQDDGKGFDPKAPAGGYGLVGMRERVEGLGGHMSLESGAGEGTTLVVQVPVPGTDVKEVEP